MLIRRGFCFRETSHMRSFEKLKPSRNGRISLSFIDNMYIMHKSRISNVANMSFNAIRENKILAKIYEFTVMPFNWPFAFICMYLMLIAGLKMALPFDVRVMLLLNMVWTKPRK